MHGFWGVSARSMEKSSPRECGLALMLAPALTSVCPCLVMAPPWASVTTPVNWGDNRCNQGRCEEGAWLVQGTQGCLLSVLSPDILQA